MKERLTMWVMKKVTWFVRQCACAARLGWDAGGDMKSKVVEVPRGGLKL